MRRWSVTLALAALLLLPTVGALKLETTPTLDGTDFLAADRVTTFILKVEAICEEPFEAGQEFEVQLHARPADPAWFDVLDFEPTAWRWSTGTCGADGSHTEMDVQVHVRPSSRNPGLVTQELGFLVSHTQTPVGSASGMEAVKEASSSVSTFQVAARPGVEVALGDRVFEIEKRTQTIQLPIRNTGNTPVHIIAAVQGEAPLSVRGPLTMLDLEAEPLLAEEDILDCEGLLPLRVTAPGGRWESIDAVLHIVSFPNGNEDLAHTDQYLIRFENADPNPLTRTLGRDGGTAVAALVVLVAVVAVAMVTLRARAKRLQEQPVEPAEPASADIDAAVT